VSFDIVRNHTTMCNLMNKLFVLMSLKRVHIWTQQGERFRKKSAKMSWEISVVHFWKKNWRPEKTCFWLNLGATFATHPRYLIKLSGQSFDWQNQFKSNKRSREKKLRPRKKKTFCPPSAHFYSSSRCFDGHISKKAATAVPSYVCMYLCMYVCMYVCM
jgi:hypothetical protein